MKQIMDDCCCHQVFSSYMMSSLQALLQSTPLPLPVLLLASPVVFVSLYLLYNLTLHPLASIPGPLVARATPFYPLYLYYSGEFAIRMRELHERHGDFVRIAPNHVAVAASLSMKQLWTTKDFEKGNFYDAFTLGISKTRDLFTIRNNHFHSQRKRIQGNIWSMTSILEMEEYIDELIALFIRKMERLSDTKELMNVGTWTWRYTFDVVGTLFFGNPYGFLEQERDIDNMMAAADSVAPFEALMGMAPPWLRPLMVWMLAIPNIARGVKYFQQVKTKSEKIITDRLKRIESQEDTRLDMVGKLLRVVLEKGEKVNWTREDVEQECFVAMVAGNDTVSITLTSIFYHLAANPSTLHSLQDELDEATAQGNLSPIITYKEAAALPYLSAVLNEGFRIHPLIGYPLPRVVPKGGAEVSGRWWPGGTYLGTSCGLPEMNTEVFGEDAATFNPERWLVDKDKAAAMWNDVCAFGIGQRACIGQHIARCEMMKLIAQFIREFDIEAASEWKCKERWFNKPQNVQVRVIKRNKV